MSEEKVNQNTENQEELVDKQQEETQATAEATPEEKFADLNDRFIRLYAEFENFRKRTIKEKADIIGSANAGLLKDMLPVLDDFERAMNNNENATDLEAVKEGFNLIYTKFKSILDSKGLKPMEAKGEVFDSELHEAIANIPAPSEDLKGKVVDDVERGYYLNEKVIRFAKVVVGQ